MKSLKYLLLVLLIVGIKAETWKRMSKGSRIPSGAVQAGTDADGNKLYVGW